LVALAGSIGRIRSRLDLGVSLEAEACPSLMAPLNEPDFLWKRLFFGDVNLDRKTDLSAFMFNGPNFKFDPNSLYFFPRE
jgi:hypothetical protein